MNHVFGIVYTHGDMNAHEVYKECKPGKWVPILAMRIEDKTFIPCFPSPHTAKQFVKRNLPRGTTIGVMNFLKQDVEFMEGKGWEVYLYSFPRKLKNLVEFNVEILETEVERDFSTSQNAFAVLTDS